MWKNFTSSSLVSPERGLPSLSSPCTTNTCFGPFVHLSGAKAPLCLVLGQASQRCRSPSDNELPQKCASTLRACACVRVCMWVGSALFQPPHQPLMLLPVDAASSTTQKEGMIETVQHQVDELKPDLFVLAKEFDRDKLEGLENALCGAHFKCTHLQ
eukprot:1157790-Pelagomonas_calceolata.AAC.2